MPAIIESEKERTDGLTCEFMTDLSKRAGEFTASLEDTRTAARHWVKRARYATGDAFDDMAHRLRRYPVRSVGVAFGAGAFLGVLLGGLWKKGG